MSGPESLPLPQATRTVTAGADSSAPGPTTPPRLTGFPRDLADQLRAGDTYGRLDRLSDEQLLKPLLAAPSVRAPVPDGCDIDPAAQARLRSFYQAVAVGIERRTGVMTGAVIDVSDEGFGRALVLAGRLVAIVDVLRDAQRFGFPDLDRLTARGERLVEAGSQLIEKYPEVARADD